MTAIAKAKRFLELMKAHGWKGDYKFNWDDDYASIEVTRGSEKLSISWVDNQWIHPGWYSLAGVKSRVNRAKDAERIIIGKPDMEQYKKRQRRAVRAAAEVAKGQNGSERAAVVLEGIDLEHPDLPFDITTDDDSTILVACRNATLVWKNKFTGLAEAAFIPREWNRDLRNTYFIGESSNGRPYLSFMDQNGVFRAVAFDQMLQIQ